MLTIAIVYNNCLCSLRQLDERMREIAEALGIYGTLRT